MDTNRSLDEVTSGHRFLSKIPYFLVVVALVPVFFVSKSMFTILAQSPDNTRKLISRESFPNEPIQIMEVKANGKDISFDRSFPPEDDWLKDLTIKFKNISGKPISFIDMNLVFQETKSDDPPLAYSLPYGVPPMVKNVPAERLRLLNAGEMDSVSIDPTSYAALKKFVALRKNIKDITTAHFSIQLVYFDDGTKWSGGSLFRPNPDVPKTFLPVTEQ